MTVHWCILTASKNNDQLLVPEPFDRNLFERRGEIFVISGFLLFRLLPKSSQNTDRTMEDFSNKEEMDQYKPPGLGKTKHI